MKLWQRIPLHWQILIAFALGIGLGILAHPGSTLVLEHSGEKGPTRLFLEHWKEIRFYREGKIQRSFTPAQVLQLMHYWNSLSAEQRRHVELVVADDTTGSTIRNILVLERPQTLATAIKPVGTLFVRLLMFVAVPLVLFSLIGGIATLEDVGRLRRMGSFTIIWYLMTTALAVTIGLVLSNLLAPGSHFSNEVRPPLGSTADVTVPVHDVRLDVVDFLLGIVPTNPFKALAEGNMLQIVFFALMVGIACALIDKAIVEPALAVFDSLARAMIRAVELIMRLAPMGVFALIAAVVADIGVEALELLGWYMLTVVAGLTLHTLGVLVPLVRLVGKIPVRQFFHVVREVMLVAFTTSSSGATLPVTFKVCTKQLGVPQNVASFVLPLGATINMDGISLYQAVAAVFIAQVYGIELTLAQQLTILLTATAASIGTAPVPGVGIVMLAMVLRSVSIPEEGIALILGVDRLLDMARTVTNVTGDAVAAVVVARREAPLQAAVVAGS